MSWSYSNDVAIFINFVLSWSYFNDMSMFIRTKKTEGHGCQWKFIGFTDDVKGFRLRHPIQIEMCKQDKCDFERTWDVYIKRATNLNLLHEFKIQKLRRSILQIFSTILTHYTLKVLKKDYVKLKKVRSFRKSEDISSRLLIC